ncbi:hypothetical protein ACFPM7_02105 [Actinokineospora guangxiensis]|uniref:Uncharacterized protein n=1 Tax=Actinokineospora guangxiensis TaxID=1490288 RepID=A0ABW0EFT6_9PSEU
MRRLPRLLSSLPLQPVRDVAVLPRPLPSRHRPGLAPPRLAVSLRPLHGLTWPTRPRPLLVTCLPLRRLSLLVCRPRLLRGLP